MGKGTLVYKNAVEREISVITRNVIDNIKQTIRAPQINSPSLKVLYYLDYKYFKKTKKIISRNQNDYYLSLPAYFLSVTIKII